jgi:hypothetical protein
MNHRPARASYVHVTPFKKMLMAAGALGALLLCIGMLSTAHAEGGGFSSADRASLAQGNLVSRPSIQTLEGAEWLGGTSFRVIDRPMTEVWAALGNVATYPYMLPATEEARLEHVESGARIVRVRQSSMGVDARYSLRMTSDANTHEIRFELDRRRPHDIEGARGFIEVRPFPGDPARTLVTWAVRVRLPDAIVTVFRDTIQVWLMRVPSTLKEYLEAL